MSSPPDLRVRQCNAGSINAGGEYVLYWMIAARRTSYSFGLERAALRAEELKRPLVVLEPLRCGYPWASDRIHRFILEGMADNAAALKGTGAHYYPYVEPSAGAGKGLLRALGERACLVITDDYPAFFLPSMVAAAAAQLPVLLEAVDSNGLLPLIAAPRAFPTARSFRLFLQKNLREHLRAVPEADPLRGIPLPRPRGLTKLLADIERRWPPASAALLRAEPSALAALPVDHAVLPGAARGGPVAARAALDSFLKRRLDRYLEDRDHPDLDGCSGLSPYLHFGHISAHEVFAKLARREQWSEAKLSKSAKGSREGFWGMRPPAEAFLEQLITWREIGFITCSVRNDYDRYSSLPEWAKRTLEKHARDPRPVLYSLEELERAQTHDPLWNAAQVELVREGRLHNYMRMLWGKKILEWCATPEEALRVMIHLNNKYALDGRDPNSYAGIFWVLGRYDRAWGPERPIFGTVRYMSSASAARKLRLRAYVKTYSP